MKRRLVEVSAGVGFLLLASVVGCSPDPEPRLASSKQALSYVPCAKGPAAALLKPPANVKPPMLPGAAAGKPVRPDPLCPASPPASKLTAAQLAKQQAYLAAWKVQAPGWSSLTPAEQEKNRALLKQQYLK